MPLFEKARIEVYLPDSENPAYADLLDSLQREFTYSFRGCTLIRGLEGNYLSRVGIAMQDSVNLLYTDVPVAFAANFQMLSDYADELRDAAFRALEEEATVAGVGTPTPAAPCSIQIVFGQSVRR